MSNRGTHAARRFCAASVIFLCAARFAGAQSIVDARRVEFSPSPHHSVVDENGMPILNHYTMQIYEAGAPTPFETAELGKPAPDADGFIRVDFISLLPVPLTPGVVYEATVSAVGPGGTTTSERSNTFGLSLPCSFSLSPTSQTFAASGGSGSFGVTTSASCQWTAVAQASWLTVTGGASGTGPGTVTYSVAPNTGSASRSGVVLAAGWNFTVVEGGQPPPPQCTFTVTPPTQTVAFRAVSVSFAVSTAAGCSWTAASPASWAVIASGAAGSGPGTVQVKVARNAGDLRSTTLTIADKAVTLTQQAKKQ